MSVVKDTAVLEEIERIVRQIVARFRPVKVILFGSYAYGEPYEGSDVDLLVVVAYPPSRREGWQIGCRLRQELPLQLIFMDPDEFEETKDVVGGLAYPAYHWGKVLYEAKS